MKLLIANLHPIKSEMDSEFSQTSRMELSSKNRQQLKAVIFFVVVKNLIPDICTA